MNAVSRETIEEIAGVPVSRVTMERLELYAADLTAESATQNLISTSTLADLWSRHVLDSAQLVRFAPQSDSSWVDIGSGAGLPGLVVAMLVGGPVTLVEPRRLRADFLQRTVDRLELSDRCAVLPANAQAVTGQFDVVTARAVAPLTKLLGLTLHLSHARTLWALPKGKAAQSELEQANRSWQCDVRSEASCTDPQARILLLSGVRARRSR